MANSVCEVLVTEARLESPEVDPRLGAGAIVDFWGVVRGSEDEREIDGIEYEAHPAMAEHQLRLIARESAKKFQLKKITVYHRVGFVGAGEASLFLRVEARHRAAAFAASKWIVDELKVRVPIWKRPRFKIGPPSPKLPPGRPAPPGLRHGREREQATLLRE
jgi:molybdopterin synthase catalytic subunit